MKFCSYARHKRLMRVLAAAAMMLFYCAIADTDGRRFPAGNILRNASAGQDTAVQFVIEDFARELRANGNMERTLVEGARAVLLENDIYRIEMPRVKLTIIPAADDKEETPVPSVIILTSENAELDKPNQSIHMFGSVKASGPDFELQTEGIRYDARKGRLFSDEEVVMNRFEFSENEKKWLSLNIRGRGLQAELPMQRVAIGGESTTTIFRVSEHFLASEMPEAPPGSEDPHQTIVIHADGNMVYAHMLQTINYHDNVRVRASGRKLDAGRLELTVERDTETDGIDIRRIDAFDNVAFEFDNRLAEGDKLEWHNITQTGKMLGEPASLTADNLKITGREMSFYRLSNRLRINGPGELVREAPPPGSGDAAPHELFASGKPVHIRWKGSMVYTEDGQARFEREVSAWQEDSSLKCENLEVVFDAAGKEVHSMNARENVLFAHGERRMESDTMAWESDSETMTATSVKDRSHVVITEPGRVMKSGKVSFDVNHNTINASGKGSIIFRDHDPGPAGDSPALLELDWSESMQWDGDSLAVFKGAVRSRQPGRKLKSDRLHVHLDEESRPAEIAAFGSASLIVTDEKTEEQHEKTGDAREPSGNAHDKVPADNEGASNAHHGLVPPEGATWELRAEHIQGLIQAEVLKSDSAGTLTVRREGYPEDDITWSENMMIDMKKMQAVFEGDVAAAFSGTNLRCRKLLIDLDESRRVRYLHATGDVFFGSGGDEDWRLTADDASAVFAAGGELDHVVAMRDVEVTEAFRRLNAQQLRLFFSFNRATGKNELQRADARDDVVVRYEEKKQQLRARGRRMQWDSAADRYEIEGDPALLSRDGLEIGGELIVINRATGEVSLPRGSMPVETRIRD